MNVLPGGSEYKKDIDGCYLNGYSRLAPCVRIIPAKITMGELGNYPYDNEVKSFYVTEEAVLEPSSVGERYFC